ncbi:MAG: hypothetical protein A3H98_07825 [Bacteroidetes bacterium RIFCSPLOWO2_02_FULL_36_8]|nr:MAG: hypothetical protein A3H98_07825 [Bacteroidetes bacterium RIFCSPLOWO2_02_FULL_36_8]OFY69017.1 MAG: hypothetical protein A3G23_13120 [Bacteroidetes bacterium RIFCSPLOWO2_12_FULL_37_12]
MNLPKILLLTFLLTLGFSCKKEPVCNPSELTKEFLDYWFFPQGSWWVYQKKGAFGIMDSMFCYSSTKEIAFDHDPELCDFFYKIFIQHSNEIFFNSPDNPGYDWFSNVPGFTLNPLISFSEVVPDSVLLFPGGGGGGDIYQYPLKIGNNTGQFLFVDTFQVSDTQLMINYNKIIHIKSTYSDSSHIYLSKNIGVVKKVYPDSSVWILTKYFINK